MVQLRGSGDLAIRMDQLDIGDFSGSIQSSSGTAFTVATADGTVTVFSGNGFTFDADGLPTGGTILGVDQTVNGTAGFSANGLHLDVADLRAQVEAQDEDGILATLFSDHDNIHGTALNDYLDGGAGNDNLFGAGGSDTLDGGDGNDHVFGFSGSGGGDGGDQLSGGDGNDYLQGNAGNDSIDGGGGSDRVNGGADDDLILGGDGNDTVNGNRGADSIEGGNGNDQLRGGQGDDTLSGGDGSDVLMGDLGADRLTGGAGNDYFILAGGGAFTADGRIEVVTDFVRGEDHLQIGYTPGTVLLGETQTDFASASLLAQQLFNDHAGDGEVAVVGVGSDSYLFYSGDAGGSANAAVLLLGVDASTISSVDF